ncbi:MAG: HAMP domain-containing histidine kinase [Herminiimonas sp.]|nr:HAMP domain-containing histidine kinase [Herminiimonas sp.]
MENQRDVLLGKWRSLLKQLPSARYLDTPTLNDHIPGLLTELATALRSNRDWSIASAHVGGTPPTHGLQRLEDGFEIGEVVAEYNILRGCIHDLAHANGVDLHGLPFHILNRVLDAAIGSAVQTYATEQAMKVQQKRQEYLAFIAHDLRTPLSAIGLAARVLELGAGDTARPQQSLQMLRTLTRNVQHLSSLVDKVLEENISIETESGIRLERRLLDLWPLVEGLAHDLHPVAGTGSTRLVNLVPVELVVYADANLLRRVFQNLIANAINYTPRGEVLISARTLDDDGSVECTVADDGSGIAPDQLEKIFEKYESNPEQTGGFGLGLAIFKTFIDAHDGVVNVKSTEGVGSTFRFTLPGVKKSTT